MNRVAYPRPRCSEVRRRWAPIAVAAAVGVFAGQASANNEPSAAELASARSLFNEARTAEEQGEWQDALARLDAVAKVKMTPQVRFHLGLCQEHLGRLLEALNNLERAASEGAEQNLSTVVAEAREHASSVRSRLPKLSIILPPGSDARVEVDGQEVASVLLTRPVAFDPGPHTVVATAPGLSFSREVSVAEGEEKRIDVAFTRVPLSTKAAQPPPVVPPRADTGGVGTEASSGPGSRWSTLGWIGVGVGGAALVGATASLIVRQGAINDINASCPDHRDCPRQLESSQNTARTFGTVGTVLGIAGGAVAVTGVVLLLQPRGDARAKVAVAPFVTYGAIGAAGTFAW